MQSRQALTILCIVCCHLLSTGCGSDQVVLKPAEILVAQHLKLLSDGAVAEALDQIDWQVQAASALPETVQQQADQEQVKNLINTTAKALRRAHRDSLIIEGLPTADTWQIGEVVDLASNQAMVPVRRVEYGDGFRFYCLGNKQGTWRIISFEKVPHMPTVE